MQSELVPSLAPPTTNKENNMKCQRPHCNGDLYEDKEEKRLTCLLCTRPHTLTGGLIYTKQNARLGIKRRIIMLLKDELMEATGLSEEELKSKLLEKAPESKQAKELISLNAITKDSWAYLTVCYGFNSKERMLSAIK